MNRTCTHPRITCLNHYDLIRKYRCAACGGVMMCACDEEFGRRCLPHQIDFGHVLQTREKVPVTLGFVEQVCNACRGLAEEPHPKAEMYGRSGKIQRYYWREIQRETLLRFDDWARAKDLGGWTNAGRKHAGVRDKIEREVIEECKEAHQRSPKYAIKEDSQDDVIRRHGVEVVALRGRYVRQPEGLRISEGGDLVSAEEFAARHFGRHGYRTLFVESTPFHVLFGTFMWTLIGDPDDPLSRIAGFGDRNAYERREKGKMVFTRLPEDFGSANYVARRAPAVEGHFRELNQSKSDLLPTFDYWVEPSEPLRQYLWAHRKADLKRARQVLQILPADITLSILRFLVEHYWARYLGWPDLLCHHDDGTFFLAEVKSSRDKLSQQQKEWIGYNAEHLRLPFKVIKIHRESSGH